jgi:prephenate dehydratase
VAEDVCGIGGLIGVKYKRDNMTRFIVLSKEGRSELRASVGRIMARGESGGSGVGC